MNVQALLGIIAFFGHIPLFLSKKYSIKHVKFSGFFFYLYQNLFWLLWVKSISRKHIADKGMNVQNLSETLTLTNTPQSSVFWLGKIASKMLNVKVFYFKKTPLVATFSDTCALTYRKNKIEQGIIKIQETFNYFLLNSTIFAFQI